MKVTKLLRIRGLVQGVYYRESMRQESARLGITGWVRNRKDGSVEALVQGEALLVEDMIRWAHRGPPQARVDSVEITDYMGETTLTHFSRKETE